MTQATARFLDLWLDAHDVVAVAAFWARALDMTCLLYTSRCV